MAIDMGTGPPGETGAIEGGNLTPPGRPMPLRLCLSIVHQILHAIAARLLGFISSGCVNLSSVKLPMSG